MAVNKVIYGGNTLVDLTGDTVTAADLADGVKATGSDGNPIVGLMQKVTIDAELSTTSTNPVQNKVINKEFESLTLTSGMLSTPSSNDAYVSKLAADALSLINDITQMTIEQSADGETWEMLFDSDTASDEVKLAYLYGLEWPTTIYITKGYMARVTFNTHTTTYFANISMYLKAICDSGNQASYKCYVGFNTLKDYAQFQDTLNTWGSWPSAVFKSIGYNIVRYVFNEDKRADLNLWFDGAQCKGTEPTRNVLRFDKKKQITTTPFGIQAPTFNGFTLETSVPANAKFTDTVYTHPATHPASMITGLSTVATSGSYNDLTNKPTIPSAYTLPNATSSTLGGVKIGSNISVTDGTISITKSNVTSALGYTPPTSDTVYDNATTTTAGLMSASDKAKLNSIADNANNYIHPPTHPAGMITGLADVAKSGSYNDLTDKPNIPASAIVDSELSSTSTNPVQNKVIYNALLNKVGTDIYSGFSLMGATSTIAWRQGSQPVGSINATNYTGTAAKATQDGAGNVITETYATKADVSGVVKSVNGTKPDTDGNVSITVSGGDGVSLSAENTWTGKQTFRKMKFGFESYNAPRISGGTDNPSESVAVYNVQGNFTLDMSVLAGLLNNSEATLFTAYIISNGAYTLSINNAGALKYVGSATDLAITANGLLLNIMLIKSNSGDVSSIVQASKLS